MNPGRLDLSGTGPPPHSPSPPVIPRNTSAPVHIPMDQDITEPLSSLKTPIRSAPIPSRSFHRTASPERGSPPAISPDIRGRRSLSTSGGPLSPRRSVDSSGPSSLHQEISLPLGKHIDPRDVQLQHKIGGGSYGIIYAGIWNGASGSCSLTSSGCETKWK